MKVWIGSGELVDLLDPAASRFTIQDIASSLSKICRFNGHTSAFYSVAEHSVIASLITQDRDPQIRLSALLHDAAEAFLGDIVKPIKDDIWSGPTGRYWERMEQSWNAVIGSRFGCTLVPMPEPVKAADRALLIAEQDLLLPKADLASEILPGFRDPDIEALINCWHPELAESWFLHRFEELSR